jgi:choline dehydrogenase-like flavoprotein
MAINLKPVDVATIGLGAAAGVAVLPLTRAGIKVAALEAGSWMRHDQFKADEIHNNVRRLVTTGTKLKYEIPTFRSSLTRGCALGGAQPTHCCASRMTS